MLSRVFLLSLAATSLGSVLPLQKRTGVHPDNTGLVRDMAPGSNNLDSYPRANYLQNGDIIATYLEHSSTIGTAGNSSIKIIKSCDEGVTWTGNYTAYTNATFTNYIDNPYPLQLANGRVLLIVRNHYRPQFKNITEYRLSMWYSDDNGETFEYLNDAVTKTPTIEGDAQGLYEPFMRIAQDGSLQLYYSEENPSGGADQDSIMRTSTDNGVTWSEPKTISGAGITARDGMLGVVNTGGSNLIAVFETTEAQPDHVFVVSSVTSSDDGKTWGNRQRVFTPDAPDHAAGSPQVIQVGGTTVVSFMNSADTQYTGYNGTHATILTSSDGGAHWGNKYNVFDMGANEPGMLALKSLPTDFMLMTSIEAAPAAPFDGALKSQRVVLS